MKTISLSAQCMLKSRRLLSWQPTTVPEANPALLQELLSHKKKQAAISRKRQGFITGVSNYGMSYEERVSKYRYIREWHLRIRENRW